MNYKKPLFIFILLFQIFAVAQAPATNSKNRVDDLLIWKISEDLKLSTKEEKDLNEVLKMLSSKKAKINARLEESIQQLAKAAESEKNKMLQDYKKELKQLSEIAIEEVDKIQKVLGSDKAAKYLVIKSEVVNRIRTLMGAQDRPESTTKPFEGKALPEPKLIEE